ncbi:LppX_LprAFG lipoprotein [Actinokineospora spheciospongiae]|uniref:LppX_LprAFG lipoprotein n=1 Tax=Actinokineospora spheciospongiae TaxID=909613 RepID=UPI00054F6E6A|nr:LppX_LprAFG lipoprotein [Actinokineospora spheciospongiae]PWW65256.1 lipoprotein LprG [Actinokineospora spheciospongiae]
MVTRRRFLGALAVVGVLVSGCTSNGGSTPGGQTSTLPDGAALLKSATEATRKIETVHFSLKVNGTVNAIPVQNADGDITRLGGGGAQGTVKLTLLGQLIEGKFVLTPDDLYLQGPTGGYQKLDASLVTNIYDPSAILDPDRGVANVLGNIQDPKTEKRETVDGVDAFKVNGRVAKDVVSRVVPGVSSDVDLSIWVRDNDTRDPVKATVEVPQGDQTATVDLSLSEIGKPVTITPPN